VERGGKKIRGKEERKETSEKKRGCGVERRWSDRGAGWWGEVVKKEGNGR